jgi:ferredoxin
MARHDTGTQVGIRLAQLGEGTLFSGAPEAAAPGAPRTELPFRFRLQLGNPSLERFLRGRHRVAAALPGEEAAAWGVPLPGGESAVDRLTRDMAHAVELNAPFLEDGEAPDRVGTVHWGAQAQPLRILAGSMELFHAPAGAPDTRTFELRFTFEGPGRERLHFSARKVLRDDRGIDVVEAGDDLSRLRDVEVRSAGGQQLYGGELRVGLAQTFEEFRALDFPGAATDAARARARERFFTLYNARLSELYDGFPVLFTRGRALGWAERQLLLCVVRAALPPGSPVSASEVVLGLDRYLEAGRLPGIAERLGLPEAVLPLLALGALAGQLVPGARLRPLLRRLLAHPRTRERAADLHTLVAAAVYSHPDMAERIGYRRPALPPASARPPPLTTVRRPSPHAHYDVLIAGSGPAGSLLADRLTAKGMKVLLLEAGRQRPHERLGGSELEALGSLYVEGGFQSVRAGKRRAPYPLLQGGALGGGATVNNAVNLRLPDDVLARWHQRGFPFSRAELHCAYTAVQGDLDMVPATQALRAGKRVNPAYRLLQAGLGPSLEECLVNLHDCLGCGLCNIGCGAGKKRDAATLLLRQAQGREGLLTLVTRARLERLVGGGGRVQHAEVRFGDGPPERVVADRYVVACGPLASSRVLRCSTGLDAASAALVGTGLSANVGAPAYAFSGQQEEGAHSLPMAHAYRREGGEGFLVETWFNTPGSVAVTMPGFLDAHDGRMRRYDRMLSAGVLVGTRARGVLGPDGKLFLPVSRKERDRLARGLLAIADAFLHPDNGGRVQEVVLPTQDGEVVCSREDVARLERALDRDALRLGTSHPQGGNRLGREAKRSVVGPDFRLHGLSNAYVCDASVFPDCAEVNPQMTVLALAHLCAEGPLGKR